MCFVDIPDPRLKFGGYKMIDVVVIFPKVNDIPL